MGIMSTSWADSVSASENAAPASSNISALPRPTRSIFYLSLKCKTTTVTLKEGYQRGKLVNPHPLVNLRKKFYHVMRMGLLYRAKGVNMIPPLNISLDDNIENETEQEETEEEEIETGEECYEETSELEDESDEE